MNRSRSWRSTHRFTAVSAVAALALAPALGAQAATASNAASPAAAPASSPTAPDIGLNVSKELNRLGDRGAGNARFDNSNLTDCMYGDVEPLTYSTREIVLREDLLPEDAVQIVNKAIGVGKPGHAVSAEVIELPRVPAAVGARATLEEPVRLTPVVVVSVVPDDGEDAAEVEIVAVSRALREAGYRASPNYLMSPTDGLTGVWPNGYPVPTLLQTDTRDDALGKEVTVAVYDVGLAPANQSNRPPNVTELVPGLDTEDLDVENPQGLVDRYYGGHTVPIADTIATLAPGAAVKAVRISNARNVVTDAAAVKRMANTLSKKGAPPQVIVNSFGSPACDVSDVEDDGEMVPLGLEGVAEAIGAIGKSVVVAAAGNRGTDRKFYPGAFDTDANPGFDAVIGVGAMDVINRADPIPDEGMWTSASRTGPLADFSNHGVWVDAWAPGVGLPVRHIDGLRFRLNEPLMAGRGLVNGTSFAAPYVGALIAEQISTTGDRPQKAWRSIRQTGVECATTGGTAVALTAMTDTATSKPQDSSSEC